MTIDHFFNDTTYGRNDCADFMGMNRQTFSAHCKKAYGVKAYEERFPSRPQVTPETKLKMLELISKTDLSYAEIGRMFDVSHTPVSKLARTILAPAQIEAREHRVRLNEIHSRHIPSKKSYLSCKAPSWFKGTVSDQGWAKIHHVNWCEANGETSVPDGYVVHHVDHDRKNNHPSNLQLMLDSDHRSHHSSNQ